MKILQIHKFFYRRGGAEVVFLDTIKGLRGRGHEISEFSMQNPNNNISDFSSYFVDDIGDLRGEHDLVSSIKKFKHFISSSEVEKKLRALLAATEPEVAHLHNVYHHLSATTFSTLKKKNIPIVLTVHDVQPMCPNHRMIRGKDNKLCEACFPHNYYNCVRYKCVSPNFSDNAAAALEAYFYRWRGIWKMVDRFICPSEFMLDKMIKWGFPREKMRLVRNSFSLPSEYSPLGDKVVYLGRFHVEKGIRVLMAAFPWLRQYKSIVAGSGPDDEWVDNFIKQYSLTNVERTGWVGRDKWREVIDSAKVVVVPSLFYENCSMAILEALSYGRVVVATDRGGNRELIKDNQTGFLVKPENSEELARSIKQAMDLSEKESSEIIKSARQLIKENHNPDDYLAKLEQIYQEVVQEKTS